MKRIYYLITTLSILLVGCTQDDTFRVGMDDVFSFSQAKVTTVDAPTTRAHLDNDMDMVWDDTDAIGIYSDESAIVTKFTNAGEYTFESETPVTGSQFYAFYPYSANAIDRNDNTVMHYSLPGSYQYDSGNYYTSSMPLVSQSTNNSFIFNLTTGLLHFKLTGKQHVTSMELKGNNGERLWGEGLINVNSNQPVFVLNDEEPDAYNTVVTLNMDLKMQEGDEKDFFFVVPVGTYEKGFTITLGIIDEDGTYSRVVKRTTRSLQVRRANMESYTEFNVADAENEDFAKEREALMAIYNALGGPDWANCNWVECYNNNTPPGYWMGANPNDEGHVIRLYLSFFGDKVKGDLPAEYGNLKYLEEIYIHDVSGITSLPKEIGNLDLVKKILIFGTGITSLPDEVADMESLTSIEMYNAPLSSFPANMSKATKLTSVALSNNNFSSFPEGLTTIPNLEGLSVGGAEMAGKLPASIGNLKKLKSLSISNTKMTGSLPASIGNLSKLESLTIVTNMISGELPGSIGRLTNLRSLHMNNNKLTGTIPSSFTKLKNLKFLDVANNNMDGIITSEIIESDMWANLNYTSINPQNEGHALEFEGGEISISEIELSETEIEVVKDGIETIDVNILPKNATTKRLSVEIKDRTVCHTIINTAESTISIKGDNPGKTEVKVYSSERVSATVAVTVKGLVFENQTINLSGNERNYKPEYVQYGDEPIKWSSSNTDVLTVDNDGVFTILKGGDVEVVASIENVGTYTLRVYIGHESYDANDPEGFNRDKDGDWDN